MFSSDADGHRCVDIPDDNEMPVEHLAHRLFPLVLGEDCGRKIHCDAGKKPANIGLAVHATVYPMDTMGMGSMDDAHSFVKMPQLVCKTRLVNGMKEKDEIAIDELSR
eukprot:670019-Rhodomonas_salina.1